MWSDCVFCQIIAGKNSAELIYEDALVIAILDINPIHLGHTLVIPKVHYSTFLDLPIETVNSVLQATQQISKALMIGLKLEGFNFFSNNGHIAGQSVFHFHIHITPRYPGDNITLTTTLKQYSDEELTYYGNLIREQLKRGSITFIEEETP
ncbi:MAG: HIT family protein [bacterium]